MNNHIASKKKLSLEARNPSSRTRKPRLANEAVIVDAAIDEFAKFGFEGSSMLGIARRAGLPRANIHYYFSNKAELYNRILMDILRAWNGAFDELDSEREPEVAIAEYVHAKVMYSRDHPKSSKIFASEIIHGAPNLRDYISLEYEQWLAGRIAVFQAWIDQGKINVIDPYVLVFLIWGSTQFYADFSIQIEKSGASKSFDEDYYDVLSKNLTSIVLKGIGLSSERND